MAKKKVNKTKDIAPAEKTISVNQKSVFEIPDLGKSFFWTFFGVLVFIAFIIYKDFLFSEKAFLFKDIGSDTVNTFYPLIIQNSRIWQNEGFQAWSFNSGMGQNVSGSFLHEPFEILLYGKDATGIAQGMGWLQFIKVVLTGVIFFFYFKKLNLTNITAAIGSTLLTFSGFMILGGCWCVFSFEIFNLSLLLLSLEHIISEKKQFLFALGIFLIGISQVFNLYVYGVFLLIYLTFRLYILNLPMKDWIRVFTSMTLLGILGVAMSSFCLFSEVLQILESPRGSGASSASDILSKAPLFAGADKTQNATSVMRFFSSDMLGTGNEFKGWTNYLEAPVFYVGIFSLLLFPQIFTFLKKKDKIASSIFMLIWLLPVFFPYFRHAFWLFAGDYYRAFSFFAAFPLTYFSIITIEHILKGGKLNPFLHFGWAVFLLLITSISYTSVTPNTHLTSIVKIIIVVQSVLIFLITSKNYKQIGFYGILIMIAFEALYFSNITVNHRPVVSSNELKMKVGYNDYSNEAIAHIKKIDPGFYRVDKTYMSGPAMHGSLNDAVVQNYYGTSSYNSFNNMNYVNFMQTLGVINPGNEVESRWVPGIAQRPILQSICAVKYILNKGPLNPGMLASNDSIAIFDDVRVLKNKFALPLGFTYKTYITLSDFKNLNASVRDITLLKAIIVEDEDVAKLKGMNRFQVKDTTSQYSWEAFGIDTKKLSEESLTISKHSNMLIQGSVTVSDAKLLFLSIPFDKGWHAIVNGNEQEIVLTNHGLMGLVLPKGKHQIELKYEQRYAGTGKLISIISCLLFLGFTIYSLWKGRPTPTSGETETA